MMSIINVKFKGKFSCNGIYYQKKIVKTTYRKRY